MARVIGMLLVPVLVAIVLGLRWQEQARARRLLEGEQQALTTLAALHAASLVEIGAGSPHPGLKAILHAAPGLHMLTEPVDPLASYATDDDYVYGLARTTERDQESHAVQHGYVLRAWPAEFGVTGNRELHITQQGVLWQGDNQRGRSGTAAGFPPLFPEPTLGEFGAPWWQRPLPDHR